jgi:ABC-type branched-subunit amino acid transport system ATPase component
MSLVCEQLSGGYGRIRILNDLSLNVQPGECVALLGKNGMGKTTFLKTVMSLTQRFSGSVNVCGQDVSSWPTHRIVKLGVSYVPQDQPIFSDLTVEENLRLGGLGVKDYAAARARVVEYFPRVGERAKQKAGTLSGGEQRMLIIARALLPRPKLVVFDEVSEGLQPGMRDRLSQVLRNYRDEQGAAILLIEQNLDLALSTADRFAVLTGGRIVEEGSVADPAAVEQIERHMVW